MRAATAEQIAQHIIDAALSGGVVCNVGQVNKPTARALDKLTRAGTLVKWRGHWYPTPGAPWGIGPEKTCWGTPETRNLFASFKTRRAA